MAQVSTPLQSFNQEDLPPNSSSPLEGGADGGSTQLPIMTYDESSGDLFEMQSQFIFLELQRLIEQYKDAARKLHNTISYVDCLREENHLLSSEHFELLSLFEKQEKSSSASFSEISPSSFSINVGLTKKLDHLKFEAERGKESPTCCEDDAREGIHNFSRSGLPKSISIRSSGFLAARHLSSRDGGRGSSRTRHPHRLRIQPTTTQD